MTHSCSTSWPARSTRVPLLWFEDEDVLYNPRLKKSYAVVDGVPVLLVDEAVQVGDAEHERLMAKAEKDGVRATGPAPG